MTRAHQEQTQPMDLPEVVPNPAHPDNTPKEPQEPVPQEPVKVPEKVPA